MQSAKKLYIVCVCVCAVALFLVNNVKASEGPIFTNKTPSIKYILPVINKLAGRAIQVKSGENVRFDLSGNKKLNRINVSTKINVYGKPVKPAKDYFFKSYPESAIINGKFEIRPIDPNKPEGDYTLIDLNAEQLTEMRPEAPSAPRVELSRTAGSGSDVPMQAGSAASSSSSSYKSINWPRL